MYRQPIDWALTVITDRGLAGGQSQLDIIRAAIAGGATVVQLRDKDASTRAMIELGQELRDLTRLAGVPLIVNDRLDVALAIEADGVHVGQSDMPADVARRLIGPDLLLGVSAATLDEVRQAERDGADYLGVGSVYATGSKADAGAPIGLEGLRAVARATQLPIVAIGGIGPGRAGECMRCGAAGVAVISAIVGQPDPAEAGRRLRAEIDAARNERP